MPIVSRWYESLKIAAPRPAGEAQLMREVNHATGNLVHRMFYWAELLEEAAPRKDAREAVENLKTSLGELHRLVTRSLDLVRDVELRPLEIPVLEVVRSIALRFGTEPEWSDADEVETELVARTTAVDPLVLDRGLGLVAEALIQQEQRDGDDVNPCCDVSPLRVRYAHATVESGERDGVFLHFSVRTHDSHNLARKADDVDAAVALALARKLIVAVGWLLDIEEADGERCLVFFFPLADAGDRSASLALA
jgi:hypothetical protein